MHSLATSSDLLTPQISNDWQQSNIHIIFSKIIYSLGGSAPALLNENRESIFILNLILHNIASYFIAFMESQKSFLEYGLMDMAFKLKEIEIINLEQYTKLSKLNVYEEDKCRVLFIQLMLGISDKQNIEIIRQFLSSDRRLWQFLMVINDFCKSVLLFIWSKLMVIIHVTTITRLGKTCLIRTYL